MLLNTGTCICTGIYHGGLRPLPLFYSKLKVDFEGRLRQKVAILAVYVTTPAFIYVDMLIVTTRQGLCLSQKNKISSFKIKS